MRNNLKLWRNRDRGNLAPFFGRTAQRPFIQKLDRLFDSMFDDVLAPLATFANTDKFLPAVEVLEQKDSLVFLIDLPGVKREHVEVEVRGNKLIVAGERHRTSAGTEDSNHYVERRFGRFTRSFTLPDNADIERVEGEYHDGVLKISIAKTVIQKSTKVHIQERTAS